MFKYILLIFYICATISAQELQESTFIIPLNKSGTSEELYSSIINIKGNSQIRFKYTNIPIDISFIIFQVHSHLFNVTLRNETCFFLNDTRTCEKVIGTNLGLYSLMNPISEMSVLNPNVRDLQILIAVHGYMRIDPVPGRCNMAPPIEVVPAVSTSISSHKDYLNVFAPAPGFFMGGNCSMSEIMNMVFYKLYLPERDFSIDTYFAGIKAMMTKASIEENGDVMTRTHLQRIRRTISAYPGTGVIFVAVAQDWHEDIAELRNATYVPIVTYGCSPLIKNDCLPLGDLLSQILCASLFFVGLFICYFGHKFFKTEMFIFGMMSGVIVSYILISLIADIEQGPLIGVSFLSGILFGFIWLTFWWFYGIPLFSVLLATVTFGFFAACVLFNQMPDHLKILMEDLNFWTIFILVMALTAIILTPVTYPANILSCSILGAYAAIYPIDYCLGSNLKYIIIDVVRRATVDKFYYAVLSPPFQKNDALLILTWVMLATTGFLFQHYHNRGKPPFPPPPRSIRESPEGGRYGATSTPYMRVDEASPDPVRAPVSRPVNETTPLLA